MDHILDNGTVLPSGLLSHSSHADMISGFNHSYRNTGIKAGIVINSYDSNDPVNKSKLCTEYDVLVIEQFEDKGTTSQLYRNCISSQGLGSLADYFEYNLRPKTFQLNKGTTTFKDQDGSIALIQCLDNIGGKAIVVGNLIHPDRPTNISGTDPQLHWEYNGLNVQILPDGSFKLNFKGATDSKGNPIDSSQGGTIFQIKTDGSFEFNHSTVDILADKGGALTINTKSNFVVNSEADMTVNCTNATVTASGKAVVEGSEVDLGKNASESVIKGDAFKKYLDAQFKVATALGPSGPSLIPVPPTALSKKVKTE